MQTVQTTLTSSLWTTSRSLSEQKVLFRIDRQPSPESQFHLRGRSKNLCDLFRPTFLERGVKFILRLSDNGDYTSIKKLRCHTEPTIVAFTPSISELRPVIAYCSPCCVELCVADSGTTQCAGSRSRHLTRSPAQPPNDCPK